MLEITKSMIIRSNVGGASDKYRADVPGVGKSFIKFASIDSETGKKKHQQFSEYMQ